MMIKKLFSRELPFLLITPALLWQFFFLFIPLVILLYSSFFVKGIFSGIHYYDVLNMVHVKVIFRSLILAFLTAISCLLMAYPVAYWLVFKVHKHKGLILFSLTLPIWVNFVVQIYAWFFLLDKNGIIATSIYKLGLTEEPPVLSSNLFAVFIVMIYCYMPFMLLSLYSVLEKINIRLLEASADLGASPLQTLSRITIPLSLSGIRTGLLLVLVPTFGEFVIPSLLGGSRYMMVGSLISYYFLVVRDVGLGAAFTVFAGFILLLFALLLNHIFKWIIVHTGRNE